jgi:hypothetical protein
MVTVVRRRFEVHVPGFNPAPPLVVVAPAARSSFSVADIVVFLAASLVLAFWASSADVLVASSRREGGTVLACQYLAGARIVERQYFDPAQGLYRQGCPLVRFG